MVFLRAAWRERLRKERGRNRKSGGPVEPYEEGSVDGSGGGWGKYFTAYAKSLSLQCLPMMYRSSTFPRVCGMQCAVPPSQTHLLRLFSRLGPLLGTLFSLYGVYRCIDAFSKRHLADLCLPLAYTPPTMKAVVSVPEPQLTAENNGERLSGSVGELRSALRVV